VFKCGNIEIDEKNREVRRDGSVVALEPKVFELLLYLVRNRDRVVPRQELFDAVWTGAIVGEAALSRCVYLARKALADAELIKVVHRRGYRFMGAVTEVSASTELLRTVETVAERAARLRGPKAPGAAQATPRASKARSSAIPAFVGRARELALAEERLAAAVAGRGGVCLVVGEAGIGKTRFLLEFMTSASPREVWIARGESSDAEGAPAYWPWLQLFRRLASAIRAGGRELETVGEELEHLAAALTSDEGKSPVAAAGAGSDRLLFFERIAEVLARVVQLRPLALVLDDLHHADLASLHLLSFLTRALASAPVVLLGAYRASDLARDPDRSAALAPALTDQSLKIELSGLSCGDVEALLHARVEPSHLEPTARALHAQTAGNPFFLMQLIPLLAADGSFPEWGQVPSGVREVIGRRIDQLGAEGAELLRVASVFGVRFEAAWLGMGQHGGDRLVKELERAVEGNLLRQVNDSPATYEFVHGLVRDALYEDLGASRRAALHRDAAVFFETCVGLDEERRLATLAHHYGRSLPLGDPELALGSAIRAGTVALGRYAYEEAASYFAQALGILESGVVGDEEQYFAVLLDLGNAQMHAGKREAALATLERAAALARRLGLADGLARVALQIAHPLSMVDFTTADAREIKLLNDALEILPENESRLRALLKAQLVLAQIDSNDWGTKETLCRDAASESSRHDDEAVELRILCARIAALWRPDNIADRTAWVDAASERVARVRDYGLTFGIHAFRFTLGLEQGDLGCVRAALEGLLRSCVQFWQPITLAEGFKAPLAFVEGRLAEAEDSCSAMLKVSERTGLQSPLQAFGALYSLTRIERGAADEVLDVLRFFGDKYREMPGWIAVLAYALGRAGKRAEARLEFDRLAEREFPIPEDRTWLACMAMLSEVCGEVGDRHRASVLYERLAPFAGRHAVAGTAISLGSMQRFLALLSVVRGDEAAAGSHFEAAIDSNTRAGARLALACTQHSYSALLEASCHPSSQQRARLLREQALRAAREFGSVYLERQIERAGRAAQQD
jgi:DNA-binding winged helix-turn-helix (wHTH) protein/tetratricopeptide (TPR) repeat protein